jgi:hypothetical protein
MQHSERARAEDHPRAIREVKRILIEHLGAMETAGTQRAQANSQAAGGTIN